MKLLRNTRMVLSDINSIKLIPELCCTTHLGAAYLSVVIYTELLALLISRTTNNSTLYKYIMEQNLVLINHFQYGCRDRECI